MVNRALFLTSLILLSSLIFRFDEDQPQDRSFREDIGETSMAALSKPALVPPVDPRSPRDFFHVRQAFLDSAAIPVVPRKKENAVFPEIKSRAALAVDLETGAELLNFSGETRWPIASITKLLTAATAMENIGREKAVLISENAAAMEGSAGNFSAGETYKSWDLVKAMLAVSSNDAAEALAEFYGKANFIDLMRKKSLELGLSQSDFSEPTGLSFVNQSSAADLAKLAKYILDSHPELLELTRQKTLEISEINGSKKTVLTNINVFAGNPDFLGGKTGFIDAASGNLLSIFSHKNHRILIIALGTEDRFGQTELIFNWIKDSYEFN